MPRTRNLPATDGGAAAKAALLRWLLASTAPDLAELRAVAELRDDLPPGWAPAIARHLGYGESRANELRRFAMGVRGVPRSGALAVLFAEC
jgi:hypothetical protein